MIFVFERYDHLDIGKALVRLLRDSFRQHEIRGELGPKWGSEHYREEVRRALKDCELFLFVLADVFRPKDSPRFDRARYADIEVALQLRIPVLVVVGEGAERPSREELPPELHPLLTMPVHYQGTMDEFGECYDMLVPKIERILDAGPPTLGRGQRPFIFVSYARSNELQVSSAVSRIVELGYMTWQDRAILGGADWSAQIEEKIRECHCVVVFLTIDAVISKWVRREIQLADDEDKPILVIQLEDVNLRGGLRLQLTTNQRIDARDARFPVQLREALASLMAGKG